MSRGGSESGRDERRLGLVKEWLADSVRHGVINSFFLSWQGDIEGPLGLQRSYLMDRKKPGVTKSQVPDKSPHEGGILFGHPAWFCRAQRSSLLLAKRNREDGKIRWLGASTPTVWRLIKWLTDVKQLCQGGGAFASNIGLVSI